MLTDQPAFKIGPQNSAFAQDLVAPEGIARQRRGWAYDGTTADVADNLVGVYRSKFVLNDNTRTVTGDDDGDLFVHNASSSGTAIFTGTAVYLPRCVYRDELIWCAQDGTTPLRRYSGATAAVTRSGGTATWTDGEATITGTTWGSAPASGSYVAITMGTGASARIKVHGKVLESTTTSLTVDGLRASSTTSMGENGDTSQTGLAYPAVPIYDAGTVTIAAGAVTGYGTDFSGAGVVVGDHMVVIPADSPPTDPWHASIDASVGSTSIGTLQSANMATKSTYLITRALPFKDAAVHKNSLFGTGVAQYPSRVYIFPPGWNMAMPPGYVLPVDPTVPMQSSNVNDFLADFVDVPSAYDGDDNVAILSSPSPLLVLKRATVYGIYGSYPNFSVDKIEDGVGCIDLRSAISTNNGQFWAGEHGIYAYVGGQVVDLTEGKINREWRALTRDFDFGTSDYCTIGQVYDHLFVSIVTGAGTTNRCYVFDMANRAWVSRFTNHKARYFFSAQVDGEEEELYWVGDNDQGRVMKSSVTVNATGIAKDGDGDSPRMQAWTGQGLDGSQSIDDDARMLDLSISHNIYDAGAAGTTEMGVSVVAGGSLEANADATKTLTAIDSDTVDRVDRTRFREVNTKGRLQQVRIDVSTTGTNTAATKIEVPELSATFRERRQRT
jgi:hypothetical protein